MAASFAPRTFVPNPYETRRYLNEYLWFHYARTRDSLPFVSQEVFRFHERLRKECLLPVSGGKTRHSGPGKDKTGTAGAHSGSRERLGLDLGCAVGRFTFELGRVVDHVLGIDNSESFIAAARQMARRGAQTVRLQESGSAFVSRPVALPKALAGSSAEFRVGDAMDLSGFPEGLFQIVAAINLLCRLPCPRRFLRQLHRLVAPGGQLLMASPFSWLEEYTPRREWLDARQVRTLLEPQFRLARRRDLPFLIREHHRKYQLVISEVMVFVRQKG